MSRIAWPGADAHVVECPGDAVPCRGVGVVVGGGHGAVDRRDLAGIRPPRDVRPQGRGVEGDLVVPRRTLVGGQAAPVVEGQLPRRSRRRVGSSLEVGERRVVGCDKTGFGTGLDGHVADRHPPLHRHRLEGCAAVLDDVTESTAGADRPDDRQYDIFRSDIGRHRTVDVDCHPLRSDLGQRLRGEDVLDLTRADAERECPERPVGRRVAVAADDGHARQGAALLRPDDVDDSLAGVAHRVVGDAELGGVLRAGRRPAWPRPRRRSGGRCPWSGRCGPRWRRSVRAGGRADRTGASLRMPAGWSPRGRDAGRCTTDLARPPSMRRAPRDGPRSWRRGWRRSWRGLARLSDGEIRFLANGKRIERRGS